MQSQTVPGIEFTFWNLLGMTREKEYILFHHISQYPYIICRVRASQSTPMPRPPEAQGPLALTARPTAG